MGVEPVRSPRILAVLPDVPWPRNSGKRIREWSVVSALSRIGDVDAIVVGSDVDRFTEPPSVHLRTAEIANLDHRSKLQSMLQLARGKPWRISATDWTAAGQRIQSLQPRSYDLVWFGSIDAWLELHHVVQADKVIVDVDDIETEKATTFLATPAERDSANRVDRLQARIERVMWARIQRLTVRKADLIAVCSTADAQILATRRAVVIPNCFPAPDPIPTVQADPNLIVLVGNYNYEPNIDGARFMAREVMPLIRAHRPDARLQLVGRGGGSALDELVRLPGVTATGEVPSTAEYLQKSAIAVAPVRVGGGTRIKIIEAFASARPTVSTTVGCHGLEVVKDRDLLIADDAKGFAEACCRLLEDPGLAATLGDAGHRIYQEFYEPESVISAIVKVTTELLES